MIRSSGYNITIAFFLNPNFISICFCFIICGIIEKTSYLQIKKWEKKTRFWSIMFLALKRKIKKIQSIDKKSSNLVENWGRKLKDFSMCGKKLLNLIRY